MATIICPHRRPQMATVRPKVMKPVRDDSHQGRTEKVEPAAACLETRVEVLEVIPEQESTAKLTDAEVIVTRWPRFAKRRKF